MQQKLCSSFSEFYPMVEVGLILDDNVHTDFFDRPLLHAATECKAAEVRFTRQTDMRHVDRCFRGRPAFEEDMRREK